MQHRGLRSNITQQHYNGRKEKEAGGERPFIIEILYPHIMFARAPLLFASNALFPISIMPAWLQDVVRVNPVSYANDAVRQLLIGSTVHLASLWVDFAVLIGFAFILSAIGIVLSWRLLSK